MELTQLSEQLATAPQVRPEDLREIASSGFVGIINNRPDAEAPDQPSSLELEAEAKRVGLAYWHVPVVPGVAKQSFGLNVARLAGLPAPLVERAAKRSAALEADLVACRAVGGTPGPLVAAIKQAATADDAQRLAALRGAVQRALEAAG